MKTSAVLSSLLLSSFVVAAPVDKRALVYATEIVTETIVIYTTVYDDDVPEATATPEGLFYEQPAKASSAVVVPSVAPASSAAPAPSVAPAAAPAPAPVQSSSAAPAPAAQAPTSAPAPAPAPAATSAAPAPAASSAAPVVEAPQPTTTEAPAAPVAAPVATSAAPSSQAQQPASSPAPSTGGEQFTNVDITIYDNDGHDGACGTKLYDTDMIVALAQPAWGASTYDRMTGAATNPWCGQKIQIDYNGNSIQATIMDLCPGCSGHDIDLSLAAWKALTGLDEKTRLKASWSKI